MKLPRPLQLMFLLAAVWLPAHADLGEKRPPAEPKVALVPGTDVAGLPRVLIIGDSISGGYTPIVREQLRGRANVHRYDENSRDTNYGLTRLDFWLDAGRWDVIHFNFGLHDLKHVNAAGEMVPVAQGRRVSTQAQYEGNLRQIVARLKQTGARLVFATTTPIPVGANGRVAGSELPFNEAARKIMAENGVPIDDLHALAAPRLAEIQKPANVHYTDAGYALLAAQVRDSIVALLPAR
ncbi:MAG: SGNH/GDSL hydrolase family protein [Opitutaceae bacterium]|nr:SGNH/GDSL hydrolase family protein [Opitutaceae bacterium]